VAGNFGEATTQAQRVVDAGRHLLHSVVRDALATGLDWWAIGELLDLHPQAAFDAYANLAVVCTGGLAAEHDMASEHGIDVDDPQHSLAAEATVARLRQAATLLGDDIWIAVKLPGEYDGDDDAAVLRRTTVALYPDELGWLREALAPNAEEPLDDQEDEDDLEPLR